MLSEFQQRVVWESWLSAEIRAAYFAALVERFQRRQKFLVVGSLLLSSGATFALVTSYIPASLSWIKPSLTLLAAVLSFWSLVAKNERASIDSADLHARWLNLALQYEALWANVYVDDAARRLEVLRMDEVAISKSSTTFPTYGNLLEKVQDRIVMNHQQQAIA
jgi:hypothetical protein